MTYDQKRIGRNIARARVKLGLSQAALAEIIGLERTSVTNIEAGRQRLLLETFVGIAAVLKTRPERLL